jgi:hypothetical protein
MAISPEQYEKLGAFYLGREYDLEEKDLREDLVLYDSKDLVTHGVVLGMTGSGKTGLCMAMLEEAAIDGVPVIAVDPKGDIGNLLLSFPNLSADEFRPWVNADEVRRKGRSTDEFAEDQAGMWKKGLGSWGQTSGRVQKLRESVDMKIYTPGSSAGLPVSILSSLECPSDAVLDDTEALADRIETTVSSLLGLMGIEADPVQSPEHILLANIVHHCWSEGQDLSLENLVRHIQQPPMRKVGVVDVESFYSESKRSALAMKLNNLLASPGFSLWLEGEPLDIQRMYYTPEGKPRVTIFCISHLSDSERMFFVSLLLNQLLGWMRAQSGTTSLRSLFYMDEIYGYLPPTAAPPSKKPMMVLLKQARAFGQGLLLATQNPVDLDYKALSNIGSWFLGRLQTERDKARVLEGLEGAANTSGGKFDRGEMERLLAGLGSRVFLMNNVHDAVPTVFHVRWVMSYLCGPLSRKQIKTLMDPVRPDEEESNGGGGDSGFLPPSASAGSGDRNTVKPRLPDGTSEFFGRTSQPVDPQRLCYVPVLIRGATVNYTDTRKKISGKATVALANRIDADKQRVLWDSFVDLPKEVDVDKFASNPEPGAEFGELPGPAMKSSTYKSIAKDFAEWVYANHTMEVHHCELLDAYSNPGEAAGDFKARMDFTAREQRDEAIEELRTKFAKVEKSLDSKIQKAMSKVEEQKAQASSAKMSTAIRIGSGLLGAFLGRRSSIASSTTISSASRAWKESRDVAAAEADLKKLQEDVEEAEQELAEAIERLKEDYDAANLRLESTRLTPYKKNIDVDVTGILWLPHERSGGSLAPVWQSPKERKG